MSLFDAIIRFGLPLVPRFIVKRVARPYVAGESLEQALEVVRRLNGEGALATLDYLGEAVRNPARAEEAVQEYLRLLDAIQREGLESNISLKPTMMGLGLDEHLFERNITRIAGRARELGNFVRLDMEDHLTVDSTLALFHKHFDECMRQHEKDIWDETRKRPFDRLLVKQFSRLFPAEGEMDNESVVISRRILPGFFLAVEMMAGKELFDQCQSACKGIVKSLKKEVGADFHWQIIYEDKNASELINDLLTVISIHFADFEKRAEWLRDLINSHLAPPEDYAFEGEHIKDWSLDRVGTMVFLRELFAPLEEMLADTESRRHIEERYGLMACQTIEELLGNLKREP